MAFWKVRSRTSPRNTAGSCTKQALDILDCFRNYFSSAVGRAEWQEDVSWNVCHNVIQNLMVTCDKFTYIDLHLYKSLLILKLISIHENEVVYTCLFGSLSLQFNPIVSFSLTSLHFGRYMSQSCRLALTGSISCSVSTISKKQYKSTLDKERTATDRLMTSSRFFQSLFLSLNVNRSIYKATVTILCCVVVVGLF